LALDIKPPPHANAEQGQATRPRRRNSGEVTRERLLDAARSVAAELPYATITVEHVTNAVGVSRATFYLHFDNKEAIYREVVEQSTLALYESSGETWQSDDVRGSIETATRRYMETFREHIGALRVLYTVGLFDDAFAQLQRASRERFETRIERHLRAGQNQGLFRAFDSSFASKALAGMVESFCTRELLTTDVLSDADFESAVKILSDLWVHAVVADPGALAG
jgi:AcrR family transcriptional regulator